MGNSNKRNMKPEICDDSKYFMTPTHLESKVSGLMKIINTIYSLVCCLLGIVLSTIEPFKTCGFCGGPIKFIIKSFLIFMYYASIICLFYLSLSISLAKRNNKIAIKNQNGTKRRLSNCKMSKDNHTINQKTIELQNLINNKQMKRFNHATRNLNEITETSDHNHTCQLSQISFLPYMDHLDDKNLSKSNFFKYTYDNENGTGEIFIRVGTGILSLCTMIDIGLNLVKLFELYSQGATVVRECHGTFLMSLMSELGAFVFTFVQCFFIFKHANIVIHCGKNLASISMCHLVCTNFCVVLRTIVHRTFKEVSLNNQRDVLNMTMITSGNRSIINGFICQNELSPFQSEALGIQKTKELIAPYLFPCAIEYSIMCLTVFYIIWNNLDNHHMKNLETNAKPMLNPFSELVNDSADHSNIRSFSIDCSKSATGLFIGLLILLITIISLIVFFIYKRSHEYLAIQLIETTELALLTVALVAIVAAFLKLPRFGYKDTTFKMNYNRTLLIIALCGVYSFSFFSITAILSHDMSVSIGLALVMHIVALLQSTCQAAFILDALRRFSKDLKSKKEKPARSLITVLLMVNLSLWLSETFSVKKYAMNRIQLDYYNIVFWAIVSSIASPLAIFFRFHSSVCLSEVWKSLYQ